MEFAVVPCHGGGFFFIESYRTLKLKSLFFGFLMDWFRIGAWAYVHEALTGGVFWASLENKRARKGF
jgi:hypothetical protein